jgi:hypothetical protein
MQIANAIAVWAETVSSYKDWSVRYKHECSSCLLLSAVAVSVYVLLKCILFNWAGYKVNTDRLYRSLTTWSRVIEKLIVSQLVKKLPMSYRTRGFVTVLTAAYHQTLFSAGRIQLTPPHAYLFQILSRWIYEDVTLNIRISIKSFITGLGSVFNT